MRLGPSEIELRSAGCHIPEFYGMLGAERDKGRRIQVRDVVRILVRYDCGPNFLAGGNLPASDFLIGPAGGDGAAVRGKRDGIPLWELAFERLPAPEFLPVRDRVDPHFVRAAVLLNLTDADSNG